MINVLFGGSNSVFDGILLCLMSMTKHTNEPLNVFVLTADVTELNENYKPIESSDIQFLSDYLKSKNPNNQVRLITLGKEFNNWILNSQNKLSQYTPFAFLRLFADNIDELPDKIIYLDTDIMLNGDIKELFDYDISNYELGSVHDRYGKIFIRRNYFNSGVLLLNLKEIKQTKLFERVKEMCLTKKMPFPDQDALNKLCKKRLVLPRKFNEQGKLRQDTIVQHFSKKIKWLPYFHTQNIKQWHIDKVQNVYKIHAYDDIYEEFKQLKNKKKHI